jgi:hypothetical protein
MAEIAGKSDNDASLVWKRSKGRATFACDLQMYSKKVKYSEGRVGLLQRFAEDLKNVREENGSALGYRKHILLIQQHASSYH